MMPMIRFAVFRTRPNVAPERVGQVTARNSEDAYSAAKAEFGEGPFVLKLSKTANEVTAYIQLNGFKRGQDRIGLMVYRAPCTGKRAKHELAIGAGFMCLYDLTNRRKLVQQWEVTP